MSCYEYIRKKKNVKKVSNHTPGYLFALKTNQTDKYHDEHGRKLKNHGRGRI